MFFSRIFSSSPTTMSQSPPARPRSSPFSIDDFNDLISNALDIDRIPLLNFAPPKSCPNSNAWIADLESYVDDPEEDELLALPLLNLDDLALDFSTPAMPTFFAKVKSRASALVRRGKHDVPSPTLDSNLHLEDVHRSRAKPLPLSLLPTKTRKIPIISAPTNTEKRSFHSSHSLFERDTHYPFSEPHMAKTPSRPSNGHRRCGSENSLAPANPIFETISPPCLIQEIPPSRAHSPYTSPRTPPLITPPRSLSPMPVPSLDYLNTRRSSDASTTSTISHVSVIFLTLFFCGHTLTRVP